MQRIFFTQTSNGVKSKKLKNKKEIISLTRTLKAKGKKVVVFSGSFELLHIGHIVAIQEAKDQGDVLIILLNSDKSIKSYKGVGHLLNSQDQRAQMLSALEAVDYITLFDELTPVDALSQIKPDVYCNGSDWGKNCIERSVVEKNEGNLHILKKRIFSTSSLIDKIIKNRATPDVKAVFLDRDGTINFNREGYVREVSHFIFVPGAIEALKKLSKTGYKIIIITNQSAIGRKVLTQSGLKKIHNWMVASLKKHGARIDGIYYCWHHPDDGCSCRKPEPEMFLRAAKDFGINLSKSWMIGDDQKDVIAAKRANIKAIKIGAKLPRELKLEADRYVRDLLGAVNIVTKL